MDILEQLEVLVSLAKISSKGDENVNLFIDKAKESITKRIKKGETYGIY